MVRVAGVDIPNNKRVEVSLRYIHGVGPTRAKEVAAKAGVVNNPKMGDLKEAELDRIREVIDSELIVESDLRRQVTMNIRRLMDIGTYRGVRHRRNLPLRGQRTRTNARTRRGTRRTVAGRRRAVARK